MTGSHPGDGSSVLDFADGKAADAFRTIGEVSQRLGIRQHVLRYWEEQFPTLKPIKRSGGRRYYRPQDVALIAEIDRLVHREGYTLKGARKAISGLSSANLHVSESVLPEESGQSKPELVFDSLRRIRDQLARALAES